MHIKMGDNVKVLTGKDRGKTGKVVKAMPKDDQVIIEGINMKKRHKKSRTSQAGGQVVEFAAPVHVSNVAVIDRTTKAPRVAKKPKAKKA